MSTLAPVTIAAAAATVRCRHGKPLWCSTIHGDDDARVGQPLCDDCYDYTGHVLFAWHAPELWRRFTIALRRLLDSHLRAIGEVADSVGINYVKVTEMQRRAIPHFHAVIRLDGPPLPGQPPTPPVSSITATDLAVMVVRAARAVTLTVTDPDSDGDRRVLRFGSQTDTQPLQPTKDAGPGVPPRSRAGRWPPTWPSTSRNRWPNSVSASDACPR